MSKIWRTKLLPFKQAQILADLVLVKGDIKHCGGCCDYFLERGEYINTFASFDDKAIHNSMLIAYRRIFTTGRRWAVPSEELPQILEDDFPLHEELLKIAKQHIAHDVNMMEYYRVGVSVAYDEDGELVGIGSIREGGTGMAGISLNDVWALSTILYRILFFIVKPLEEQMRSELGAIIKKLSIKDVLGYEDGDLIGGQGKDYLKLKPRMRF